MRGALALLLILILLAEPPALPAQAQSTGHHYELVETRIVTVRPNFTEQQWEWINQHWRDQAVYVIADQNGVLWRVGMGYYPRETNVTVTIYKGSFCIVVNGTASASPPPIGQAGATGGVGGTPVTWFIFNNTASYYWSHFPQLTIEKATAGWSTTVPSCYGWTPLDAISFPISPNVWSFRYSGLGPAFSVDVSLPSVRQDASVYFVWELRGWYNGTAWNEGPREAFVYIWYDDVVLYAGEGPRNPVAKALYAVFSRLEEALSTALRAAGEYILDALRAVLPDELEALLADLWNVFNILLDVFAAAVAWLPHFTDYIGLLAALVPVLAAVVLVSNPLAVVEFFVRLLDYMRRIVEFIRSLLPI